MGSRKRIILLAMFLMAGLAFSQDKRDDDLLHRQIKTRYNINGRAVNQKQITAGRHIVVGLCTLSSGVDTVTLNTSAADGKQNVSFIDSSTYSGRAWSSDITLRSNVYSILPLSATKFVVVSSQTDDSAIVRFNVEGE